MLSAPQIPLSHEVLPEHMWPLVPVPLAIPQLAAKFLSSDDTPWKAANVHTVPPVHSPVASPEQQVSMQVLPSQSPDRQSRPVPQLAPGSAVPMPCVRPTHAGWTQ